MSSTGEGEKPMTPRPEFVTVRQGETLQVTMSATLSHTSGDEHTCPAMAEAHSYRHDTPFRSGYDEAIKSIQWTERGWCAFSVNGGEYGSRIWFCPFCGEKLP